MTLLKHVSKIFGLMFFVVLLGCGSQPMKFETLQKRDKLRFAACRHDVARYMCPDDPDCAIKAAELYAAERHDARLQWLIDYNCPKDKILHVDKIVEDEEKSSIGMK